MKENSKINKIILFAAAIAINLAGCITEAEKELRSAVMDGNIKWAKSAMERGADPLRMWYGFGYLHIAADHNKAHMVKYLIENGLPIDAKGSGMKTALHIAGKQGFPDVIRILAKAGADVNALDRNGWTALHFAAFEGHLNAVTALVESGTDPNIKDRRDRTAEMLAVDANRSEVVQFFKERRPKGE